jgi:capsule polysaccharide export protein KpsE/RkpR
MFDNIKKIIGIVLVIIIIAVILFYLGLFVTA